MDVNSLSISLLPCIDHFSSDSICSHCHIPIDACVYPYIKLNSCNVWLVISVPYLLAFGCDFHVKNMHEWVENKLVIINENFEDKTINQ